MKKNHALIRLFALVLLMTALFAGTTTAQAIKSMPNSDKLALSRSLINSDGTLRLDGRFSGSVPLDGWNVQFDNYRGPIFSHARASKIFPGELSSAIGSWGGLGSNGSGEGSLNNWVFSVAVSGSDVYVGGWFTDVNNNGVVLSAADYIVKWDGVNWSALGSNGAGGGSLNGFVNAIEINGSNIYVGGSFTNVNNNGLVLNSADYIARWDGVNWTALGNNGSGDGSIVCCDVMAIETSGNNVYVGGNFMNVNNINAADGIAKWDGANWSALGSDGLGDGSINSWVDAIAVIGSDVYVGGPFDDVNNNGAVLNAADFIAKWDGTNWSALGSNGAGDGSLNWWVNAIAASGSDIYVGGGFTDINNNGTILPAADRIAKWDGTNWSALGSNGAGNGSINSKVETVMVNGSDIYIGGWFWDVNNNGVSLAAADSLAKWDGVNWSALGGGGVAGGSFVGPINDIAFNGNNIYVGGDFNDVSNNGTVVLNADKVAVASLDSSTFVDVPFDHPLYKYIEALYQAGFTAGCSTTPLMFCPDTILDRAQSAVFMLRGQLGSGYTPPSPPWTNFVNESWVGFEWAQPWAEGMYMESLTTGCQASPLKFCPANQLPRVEASIFGLKMKYGVTYTPPLESGTLFADFPSTDPSYWGIAWAEKAYLDGLLPACGTDSVSGKPMFCPGELVNRGWGAYLIVKAKNLPTP